MKKCVIIGSGLGGLSTGVILAKNGYEVTILEQSHQIGGCLQCFVRGGVKFETGMHFIGSMEDGQILSNYFKFLEIHDKVDLMKLDEDGYEVLFMRGEEFHFPFGRKAFIEYFSKRFPSQRENLEAYYDKVEKVASLSSYYRLDQPTESNSFIDDELMMKNVNEVIDETITDPLLREVLVGDMPLYAAKRDKTSFSTLAFIENFYNQSAFRVIGGSDQIAKALNEVLEKYGGRVLTRHKVTKIMVEEKNATGVMTENGEVFPADVVVSDVHPSQIVDLVEEHAFTSAYKARVNSIPNTVGIFSVYLRFKDGVVPYINYNYYHYNDYSPWEIDGRLDAEWPRGYLYMHHCYDRNDKFAKGGVIMSFLAYDELKKWENTTIGHRGADYEQLKKELSERLLDAVEKDFPGLKENIAGYWSSTPLTYRDYTSTPEGSMYGMVKDTSMGAAGRVSFKTKVRNLFLAGQNINSHGMLGVLVGSLTVGSYLVGEEEIKKQILEANRKTAVIIGGGMGGLFTGALLTKEGYRVTILEKNVAVGGGLQMFHRDGVDFETGMHMLGGLRQGGSVHKVCTYLGIMDKLQLRHNDADCMDSITYLGSGKTYRIPEGREAFTEYFIHEFPDEEQGIRDYVDALYSLADEVNLFNMRCEDDYLSLHSEQFLWSADELIAHYIKNERLRDLLAYMNPMYGGVKGHTPAYIHALINVLYINGQDRFEHGSQQLADLLAGVIQQGGGQVLTGEKVTQIHVDDDRNCTSVTTAKGNAYSADYYISDIHPQQLVELVDPGAFPKAYKNRVAMIPNSYSAFILFIKLRKGAFPFINHTCYFQDGFDKVWSHGSFDPNDEKWPHGFMYMTSEEDENHCATKMVINCLMPFAAVEQWKDTRVGHRGPEYEQWKQRVVERVLNRMEQLRPGFHDTIDKVWASSPLTIRDYLGQPEGALYGMRKDCKDILLSQLPVVTKVKNLLLTGQNINLHGICGVPLTSINTVEALIGRNKLVEKINNQYNKQYGND